MNSEKITYEEIKYVKLVSVGSVNPNNPLSDNSREKQVELLNRCLNGKGHISYRFFQKAGLVGGR